MTKNLYVGNLPFSIGSEDLEKMFAEHGAVSSAKVISDRDTGRSRGFGFVEMDSADDAEKAIEAIDGFEADGRTLTVNEARERAPSRDGGGGGRGGYGGGGGGGRRDRY